LPHRYRFDRFEIVPSARQLLDDGAVVNLGARAFDVLHCLVENAERVITKDELIDRVWPGLVVTENNLSVQVSALRKLLGVQAVLNVPGRGYQFALAVQELAATPLSNGASTVTPALPVVPEVRIGDRRQKHGGDARHQAEIDLRLPDKPSIAVLPFLNLSSDPQQDYFADAISEDITTELSRFKALFVIARNSAFSYKGRAVDVRTISA
jgi:DNA-binding winged helix-turn-helix (wHTH) protein